MVGLIDKVMNRYGSKIVLERAESRITFRGFLHHTASKDWHNMEKAILNLPELHTVLQLLSYLPNYSFPLLYSMG